MLIVVNVFSVMCMSNNMDAAVVRGGVRCLHVVRPHSPRSKEKSMHNYLPLVEYDREPLPRQRGCLIV